jgi:hypothetical protein
VPAVVSSSIANALDRVGPVNLQHAGDLRAYFDTTNDPQDARDVRHALTAMVTMAGHGGRGGRHWGPLDRGDPGMGYGCTAVDAGRVGDAVGGHYVFIVKKQLHRPHDLLHDLDWTHAEACAGHDTGHGRIEQRTLEVLPAPENIDSPNTAQVFRITRQRTDPSSGKQETHTWVGLTDLPPHHADPTQTACLSRGHWHIENRLHWAHDVTYGQDHSRVRTGTTPQTMATLRNLTINALCLTGATNTAQTHRAMTRDTTRPLTLLGTPTPTSPNRL